MTDKACATCAHDMGPCWDDCVFPGTTDGSPSPMFVEDAMPSRADGGKNCLQYMRAIPTPA